MIGHAEGGMSMPDLQALIDTRIPDNRTQLDYCHSNLRDVADYCEQNYVNSTDRGEALVATKQYAIQSLASVAFQINTMARDLLDMLELQTEKVNAITNQVQLVNQVVNIHKEKLARREIGSLTTNKTIQKQPKILAPAVFEPKMRYNRTPIDYSVLDCVGHGVKTADPPRTALISRAGSTISGNTPMSPFNQSHNDSYGSYNGERTATLGRPALRQGYASSIAPSDYRVPNVAPISEHQRMAKQLSNSNQGSDYGDHLSGVGSGSHHGSSSNEYSTYTGDRYGTIRAPGRTSLLPSGYSTQSTLSMTRVSGGESPVFPPPAQLSSQHYGGYVAPGSVLQHHQKQHNDQNGTLRKNPVTNRNELPPPPSSLLVQSTNEDFDDLPPPPESVSGASTYGVFGIGSGVETAPNANLFDVQSEWVPEGEYIEKAIVLYDYEAEKADELTLRENALVYVVRKNEDGWFEGVLDGVTGLFPGNYVQALQ